MLWNSVLTSLDSMSVSSCPVLLLALKALVSPVTFPWQWAPLPTDRQLEVLWGPFPLSSLSSQRLVLVLEILVQLGVVGPYHTLSRAASRINWDQDFFGLNPFLSLHLSTPPFPLDSPRSTSYLSEMYMNLNPQFRYCNPEYVSQDMKESVNLVVKVNLGNCDTVCFSIKNKHQARFSGKREHYSNWPCDICKQSTGVWLIPQSLADHIYGRSNCQFSVAIRENPDVMLLTVLSRSSKISLQHPQHLRICYVTFGGKGKWLVWLSSR